MSTIQKIIGREILESRGNPTVEVEVVLASGARGQASVPSGASTGRFEAIEVRDQDKHRYLGKGVLTALHNITQTIAPALINQPIDDQVALDNLLCELDGTPNKAHLGANALLAVSLALARARANEQQQPLFLSLNDDTPMTLPIPLMNLINGGAHADNNLEIQEFMIAPIGASSFAHAVQMGAEIFHRLKQTLQQKQLQTAVGDEGGFAPSLRSHEEALDLLSEAVIGAGYRLETDVIFALDVAASELFDGEQYHFKSTDQIFSAADLIAYYQTLINHYPIRSIEDGLDQSDWNGWQHMTAQLGQQVQLVGDDIFVTHTHLLEQGIAQHVANAILIKPNQVGTLTETRQAIQLAKQHDYVPVMSHRSAETADTFIADLAVATGCPQIKTGSLCRMDRVEKYNQLLRIQSWMQLPYAATQQKMRIMGHQRLSVE